MYDKLVTGLESSNSVCSPIRVINKSDSRFAVVKFYCHEYDYTPNWTLLSPITIIYSTDNAARLYIDLFQCYFILQG